MWQETLRSCHNPVAIQTTWQLLSIGLQELALTIGTPQPTGQSRPSLGHGHGRHWTRPVQINCCNPALECGTER